MNCHSGGISGKVGLIDMVQRVGQSTVKDTHSFPAHGKHSFA